MSANEKSYKVFVINLARSPDRLASITEKLRRLGVPFERVEAADGEKLTEEEISKYYSPSLNRRRMTRFMTKGEIGCYISHIYCWKKIVSERLDFAITIEDDVSPNSNLKRAIEFLSGYEGDIGYLQLGWCEKYKQRCKVKRSYGKFEIVQYRRQTGETPIDAVSYKAARTLLENCIPFGRPVDTDANFYWETKVRRYGLRPYSYIYVSSTDTEFGTLISGRKEAKETGSMLGRLRTKRKYFYLLDALYSLNLIVGRMFNK